MTTSEQINELAAALAKAQGEITPAEFDASNPHFRSKYASLASITAAVKAPLAKNGLAVVQGASAGEGSVTVTTRIIHASGQFIGSELTLPVGERATPQAVGSAITYGRRYGMAALVGVVAEEDDDGNNATANAVQSPAAAVVKTAAPSAQSASSAPLEDASEAIRWRGKVDRIEEKTGTSAKGPWTITRVTVGGSVASTFDAKLREAAEALQKLEADVVAEVRPGRKAGSFELVALEEDLPL
jgi:hypothetical protein